MTRSPFLAALFLVATIAGCGADDGEGTSLDAPGGASVHAGLVDTFFGCAATGAAKEGELQPAKAPLVEPRPFSLIYLLPEASVAAVAELTTTPRPRTLRRITVVRAELTGR